MSVSLIVVQYGKFELLENLFDSLINHGDREIISEIVVVDNGGNMVDKEMETLKSRTAPFSVEFVINDHKTYASGVNQGAETANGDVLIISNNDIEWREGWSIEPIIEMVHREDVGAVGPQLVNEDGSWQRSYDSIPSIWAALRSILFLDSITRRQACHRFKQDTQQTKEVGYVDGAFLATSAETLERRDGWDNQFTFYAEDADYCYRIRQGGERVMFQPAARIVHQGGAATSEGEPEQYAQQLIESSVQFVRQYKGDDQAQVYVFLMSLALLERRVLYAFLNTLRDSDGIKTRHQQTRMRLQAFLNQIWEN